MERAQFYADLMFNLAPDLARHPYDEPHKNWKQAHLSDLTIVPIGSSSAGGHVYGSFASGSGLSASGEIDYIAPFFEAFEKVQASVKDSGYLHPGEIRKAQSALSGATLTSFKHAVDAIPLAHVLLVGEVLNLVD